MKKPYYNEFDRYMMRNDTFNGAWMNLGLEFLKLGREIFKSLDNYCKKPTTKKVQP